MSVPAPAVPGLRNENGAARRRALNVALRRVVPVLLAGIGGALLAFIATTYWRTPSDEHAYWLAGQRLLAGQPLYDPTAVGNTPFAYWYPPIVAQVLAPVTAVLPSAVFSAAWIGLLLACLWWLSGRRLIVALALVAFLPVAVELMHRNVHLVLTVLVVLAIRRLPVLFAVGAAIKIAPGIGLIYLAARGRWRDAAITAAVGALMLAISVALDPSLWLQYFDILVGRGPLDSSALLPIPYVVRAAAAFALAFVAGRLTPRVGEPLLVVAIVLALPTLWATGLSLLVALVPLIGSRGLAMPDLRIGRLRPT